MFQQTFTKLVIGFVMSLPAWAGNATGGGGGDMYDPSKDSAWFLGDGTVRYCLESGTSFGVSNDELVRTIDLAFETWGRYIIKKNIHRDLNAIQTGVNLATSKQLLPNCDGTEDLKFYFGTSNKEIEEAKKLRHNPVAFAERTSYSSLKGWSKGYIWIAAPKTVFVGAFPDWTKTNHLLAILLHEMGHVFGCDHAEGTIMSEFIGPDLAENNPHLTKYLDRIDWTKELLLCEKSCSSIYPGELGQPGVIEEAAVVFRNLTGKFPNGKISAVITSVNDELTLNLLDSGSAHVFNINRVTSSTSFTFGRGLFRIFRQLVSPTGITHSISVLPMRGKVLHGSIGGANGVKYSVQVYRNSNETGSPMVLRYSVQNQERVLFWSNAIELQ